MKHLFICGCPRSGTTALWTVISSHIKVAIGVERYLDKVYPKFNLIQQDFLKERFLNLKNSNGETNLFSNHAYYKALEPRYNECTYYGDKIPFLYENFEEFFKTFPNANVLFIIRNLYDVAQSYKVRYLDNEDSWNRDVKTAVRDWNRANDKAIAAIKNKRKLKIIEYEKFFFNSSKLNIILDDLYLSVTEEMEHKYKNMMILAQKYQKERMNILESSEKLYIQKNLNYNRYKILLNHI